MEKQSSDIFEILLGDLTHATDELRKNDSPTCRRNLVRTAFAAIEGLLWITKLRFADYPSAWTAEEVLFLKDCSFAVAGNGIIKPAPRFTPIDQSVRAISRLARKIDPNFDPCFKGKAWHSFLASIVVRNRITHPKSVEDVQVSATEAEDCVRGFYWLAAFVMKSLRSKNQRFTPGTPAATFTDDELALIARMEVDWHAAGAGV